MRISLFLNSTMSKTCVRPQMKNWTNQDKKSCTYFHDNKRTLSYKASGSKELSLQSPVSRIKQLPDFLNSCYELQWLLQSRSTLSQALNAAIKQIYSLSRLLLLYLTILLLTAQVAGLALLLSCATSLPLGFLFMMTAVVLILVTAFKTMY